MRVSMLLGFSLVFGACVQRPAVEREALSLPWGDGGWLGDADVGPLRPDTEPWPASDRGLEPDSATADGGAIPGGSSRAERDAGERALPADGGSMAARAPSSMPTKMPTKMPARTPTAGSSGAAPAATHDLAYGSLLISELMADPKALTDADGEWFELYNATADVIELTGCTIGDGAEQPRAIAEPVRVAAGEYVTVARTPEPGFTANVVSALSLKNGADVIELSCGGTLLDRVSYDKAQGFPLSAGIAAALDPAQLDADANDSPAAWCLAADAYATDLGTPGRPNAPCSLDVEDAGMAAEL